MKMEEEIEIKSGSIKKQSSIENGLLGIEKYVPHESPPLFASFNPQFVLFPGQPHDAFGHLAFSVQLCHWVLAAFVLPIEF